MTNCYLLPLLFSEQRGEGESSQEPSETFRVLARIFPSGRSIEEKAGHINTRTCDETLEKLSLLKWGCPKAFQAFISKTQKHNICGANSELETSSIFSVSLIRWKNGWSSFNSSLAFISRELFP